MPWQHAVKLLETIAGDAALTLLKHGDHRLSTPADLAQMTRMLDALVEDCGEA